MIVRDIEKAGIIFVTQVFVTKVDDPNATLTNSPALSPQVLAKETDNPPPPSGRQKNMILPVLALCRVDPSGIISFRISFWAHKERVL